MTFASFARLYAIAFVIFMVTDLVWLGVIARPFYDAQLGHLLRPDVLWPAAIAFYLFFLLGLVVFVVAPAVEARSTKKGALLGAFFGFITYQTYELTNFALVKDWPFPIVVVDILWGVVLATIVSAGTVAVHLRIQPPK